MQAVQPVVEQVLRIGHKVLENDSIEKIIVQAIECYLSTVNGIAS